MSNSNQLHSRAGAVLQQHGDALQDAARSDDLVFLHAMVRRNVVFGDIKQQQRMAEIENYFSADISGCIKSNR